MSEDFPQHMITAVFDDAMDDQGFSPEGFTIIEEIDRGGMSVVYLAEQHEPKREVALKIVAPRYAGELQIRERFQREGQAMANLDHPGILPVYQVGEWDGLSFIAMKLAAGGSLQDFLEKEQPDPSVAVNWIIAVSEAVHFAHQSGVLHRDLKPANLLFNHDHSIYVSDFGVAKLDLYKEESLTMTNTLIGTPHYLAPEVAAGNITGGSVATDLYGLGAILYRCLTGKIPHDGGTNLAAQLRKIVEQDLISIKKVQPHLPRDLCVICEKALEKKPEDRYRSVFEFAEDLKRWRSGLPIYARPASLIEKWWMTMKRYPFAVALLSLLLVTITTSGILFFKNYQKRGELLRESLIERARAERLIQEPEFRSRVIDLLRTSRDTKNSSRIREEVIAVMAYWDVTQNKDLAVRWVDKNREAPYKVSEAEGELLLWKAESNFSKKVPLSGILRCAPACSLDGRFLTIVCGERIEIVIYDVIEDSIFATIPLDNWPENIVFSESGDVIKVLFDNTKASLYNIWGDLLLNDFHQTDYLSKPIGVHLWKGYFTHSLEARPYRAEVSPTEKLIATTSALGVRIWNVNTREAISFYSVENQRIDSPTDAWWLDDNRLLIQVPGAQEIIEVDPTGKIVGKYEHQRVPGASIRNISSQGDWYVEIRTEDNTNKLEIWAKGNPKKSQQWIPQKKVKPITHQDGVISYKSWKLTIPAGKQLLETVLLHKEQKVLALTRDYHIYEWDLAQITQEIERLEF